MTQAVKNNDMGPEGSGNDRREISQNILRSLRIIYRAVQAHSRRVEKQCGVSGAELRMMWEIRNYPGIRVSGLAVALAIQAPTCSNLLVKLQVKGLVRRERSDPDHRAVRVFLTEKGTRLLTRAPRPAQGYLQEGLGRMTEACLRDLDFGLEQLVNSFTGREDAAGMMLLMESE
jgi:DNA-binding MarR family transcriptional regulator